MPGLGLHPEARLALQQQLARREPHPGDGKYSMDLGNVYYMLKSLLHDLCGELYLTSASWNNGRRRFISAFTMR